MRVLNTIWFTTGKNDCIGLVLAEDEITKERKAYIGVGHGHDEQMDIETIKDYGAKVYPVAAEQLIEHLKGV